MDDLIVDLVEGEEMRKKTVSVIVLSLLVMLTLTFSIQLNALAQKTKIVIGVSQSYSGVNAPGCMMHHLYYDMIIADYNAKGGLDVPGYGLLPIELKSYDDESIESRCLDLIVKLITEDHVDLMFGPWSTEFNVAAFPIFEQYKMPVVALTVGSDAAAKKMKDGVWNYSFMVLGQPYEDAAECTALLKYCNSTLGGDTPVGPWSDTRIRKVGILYRSDLHGTEHVTAIGNGLTAAGFTVVTQAYPVDIADFTAQISWLAGEAVDVAMISGYGEAMVFFKQCIAYDYNAKMMFHGPVLETPLMMYAVFGFTPGEIAGLTYYDGFPATNYTTPPALVEWAARHKQLQGFLPFPAAAPAFYTGIQCLFEAVESVGLDHTAIRDALRTQTWDTLMGKAKLRIGQSIEVEGCGTLTQWQGKEMMDVIWPRTATPTKIIYPKFPWSWAKVPDINRDGKVDMKDVGAAAKAFGSYPGHPRWDFVADWNRDGKVDMKDIGAVAKAFGQHFP